MWRSGRRRRRRIGCFRSITHAYGFSSVEGQSKRIFFIMDKNKLNDFANRLAKGGKGAGVGLGFLAAAGGLAYTMFQSMYTGQCSELHAYILLNLLKNFCGAISVMHLASVDGPSEGVLFVRSIKSVRCHTPAVVHLYAIQFSLIFPVNLTGVGF